MEVGYNHRVNTDEPIEELDINKYWLVLKRHWLPSSAVFAVVVVLAGALASQQKPTFQSEGKLLLRKTDPAVSLLSERDGGQRIGELEPLSALNTPVDTEAEVVRSTPLVQEMIQRLGLKDEKGELLDPEDVLKKLKVEGIKGADVLVVSYEGEEPKESASVVNTLMNIYIENNVLINRSEATAARKFIAQQLPKTESKLRQAEINLKNFREQNNVIALPTEAESSVSTLADLDSQITKAQTALADANAQTVALQGRIGLSPEVAVALNSLSQSPGVQQVLEDYRKVETLLTDQRTKYRSAHPEIASLERREAALRKLLQERVGQVIGGQSLPNETFQLDKLKEKLVEQLITSEITRQGLANQLVALAQRRAVYQQRANLLPKLEQVQQDLDRQVKTAQAEYDLLVKRLQEVQIAENQNVGNARIVASALVPNKPIGSQKKLFLGAGVVVGALLYVIVAFLLDLGDRSIKTVKELRGLFGYTVLGVIPSTRKGSTRHGRTEDSDIPELSVKNAPSSMVSESYRMLQANLKFLSPDRQLKSIVITSSVPKEGKSTVSANLASAMAQLGHRVLLVDADLRHPMQHHIWELTNMAGLSDVIVGQADLASVVTEVMPNLSVIPSGAVPPNSLALIDSKRMSSLLNDFSNDYDFVIVDTSPLVLVADALTLGKMTDGILLVTRPGVVDTTTASTAKEFLLQSKQTVLGLVINGVTLEHEPSSLLHRAEIYYKDFTPVSLPRAAVGKF